MIVANRKPIPEIRDYIKDFDRVLLVGCGACVTVCLAGGEREVGIIGSALRMSLKLIGRGNVVVDECTIERQCDDAFVDPLASRVADYDAVCSFGCGVGVQFLASRFPNTPVFPGLNTQFMGALESQGVWIEKCSGCGECRLAEFMGICPVSRCSKRLFNGPCGGSRSDGKCEIGLDIDCAWQQIHERAKALGLTDKLNSIAEVQDWLTALDGGPRKVVREDQYISKDDKKE